MYLVVHVSPPKAEHFLTAQPKSEGQVDGYVPGILAHRSLEDAPSELRVDDGEACALADRPVHEFRCGRVAPHQATRLRTDESLREHTKDVRDGLRVQSIG